MHIHLASISRLTTNILVNWILVYLQTTTCFMLTRYHCDLNNALRIS